jgi:hypothetical protein
MLWRMGPCYDRSNFPRVCDRAVSLVREPPIMTLLVSGDPRECPSLAARPSPTAAGSSGYAS